MKAILPDQTVIYYDTIGEGMPLVLLHGNFQNSKVFKDQVSYFSKSYKVITIDSRGHGESTFGHKKLTISLLSSDISFLLHQLVHEPFVIIGFSDGANIALKLAIENSENIAAMVLISPNVDIDGIHKSFYNFAQIGYYLLHFLNFITPFRKMRNILYLILSNPDISLDELEKIHQPVLLLSGTKDIIKRQHIELIASHMPFSQLTWISNAPHMLLKSRSNELNKLINDFIKLKPSGVEPSGFVTSKL
ncbi:alpha/beta fold hydrolase [Fusibacter bizertensis]